MSEWSQVQSHKEASSAAGRILATDGEGLTVPMSTLLSQTCHQITETSETDYIDGTLQEFSNSFKNCVEVQEAKGVHKNIDVILVFTRL